MKFLNHLSTSLSALLIMGIVGAIAAPDGVIRNSVAICNADNPTDCLKPDSAGNMPIIGNVNASFSSGQPVIIDPVQPGDSNHSLVSEYTLGPAGSITFNGGNRVTLYGFNVTSGITGVTVMLFNLPFSPSDGAVNPVKCYMLPQNSTINIDFRPGPPLFFDQGLTIVTSKMGNGCFDKVEVPEAFISGEVR